MGTFWGPSGTKHDLSVPSVEGREKAAERCPCPGGVGPQGAKLRPPPPCFSACYMQSLVLPLPRSFFATARPSRSLRPHCPKRKARCQGIPLRTFFSSPANVTSPRPLLRFARLQDVGDRRRLLLVNNEDRRHAWSPTAQVTAGVLFAHAVAPRPPGPRDMVRFRRQRVLVLKRHPFLILQTEHDRLLIERHRNSRV